MLLDDGFKALIDSFIMRDLVKIRSLVTQDLSKGFGNQTSYLEFHGFLNYFAIFDTHHSIIMMCQMFL